MNMKQLVTTIPLLLAAKTAFAVENPLGDGTGNLDTIPQVISAILEVIVQIGTIILVLYIIWSGYLFVTAQGNVDQVKRAKSSIKWAVLGGALLLGAWALSVAIKDTIAAL